jgi:hypothetical protein
MRREDLSMNARPLLVSLALCLLVPGSWGAAEKPDGGELGILLGAYLPDRDLTGQPGTLENVEPTGGIRGDHFFAPRWGWFVDALYGSASVQDADVDQYTARAGFQVLSRTTRRTSGSAAVG